ncbi:HsdM family class I SAM-dependent methyltransferase [Actinomyces radicidentis]|uniref:HsdM family class I SAM-dependent methyltransferase n=1 Tax=Actinomyces radicidentis TaxID=111015 RepID=UPI0009FC3FE1|nr:N-6 DNA methylase [Actinomyces radicidentis]
MPDLDDRPLRKSRGAFFTPPEMARYIAAWAIREATDSVLEPSCGEAIFLEQAHSELVAHGAHASKHGQLVGVDLHQPSVDRARTVLASNNIDADLRAGDFFELDIAADFDAVIGNPPYIRYQDFQGQTRAKALEAALQQGVRLSGLTSSWAPFTVHACSFLKPGGRLGLILPAELLSVTYAGPVRKYLLEHFTDLRLIAFEERVFPNVQEEVVLLLADGFAPEGPGVDHFELVQRTNLNDLEAQPVITTWAPAEPTDKWLGALGTSKALESMATGPAPTFVPLDSWGHLTLGTVTGANKYFAMSPGRADELGISARDLLPLSPPGSAHLRSLELTSSDLAALGSSEKKTYLFYPTEPLTPNSTRYIELGEALEIDHAYKCRVRTPWWKVPLAKKADIFVTYMNDESASLCANVVGAIHLNSVHGLLLSETARKVDPRLLCLASQNSATALSAEQNGRSYGGGLLKLEPREARSLLVPTIDLITEHLVELSEYFDEAKKLLNAGEFAVVRADVDKILGLEANVRAIDEIRQTHQALRSRRLSRSGRSQP